jgi:N-acetylglucosamine-6-phosphate deacetylase
MAGAPLWDAVAMASLTPASVLGIEAKKGSIETGKDADLVLLDESLAVKEVFIGGKLATISM